MRFLSFLLAPAALLLIMACGESSPNTVVKAAKSGITELKVGQTLEVALPVNPTTGYNWRISEQPGFLELIGEVEYQEQVAEAGRVGTGGTNIWKFKAKAAGNGFLRLAYQRAWEKDVPPAETTDYELKVTP